MKYAAVRAGVARAVGCTLALAVCTAAWGQSADRVESASRGVPPGEFRKGDDDRSLLPPGMPPLHLIPPMPRPEPGPVPPPADPTAGSVIVHDAQTGESIQVPALFPSGMIGDQGIGNNGAEGQISEDDRAAVESFVSMTGVDESVFPWRMNCKLAMRFRDQGGTVRWFVCSGAMIDVNTVVTAAHCVYARNPNDSNGNPINIFNWAEVIYVFPGWDGNNPITPPNGPGNNQAYNNFGFASGTFFLAGTDYINNGNFDRDCGLVRLSDRAVGALTGWFGWAWGFDCGTIQSRTYHNASFPSENCGGGLHTGTDMYYWYGTYDSCPGNQLHLNTTAGCFTTGWGGMSGSGAYYIDNGNRLVHATDSNGNRANNTNYCKLWEQFVNDMNGSFIPGSRGGTFDLQALDCNWGSTFVQAGAFTSAGDFLSVNPTNADPANRTYTYHVYLSSNDNITTSDTFLGTFSYTWDYAAVSWVRVGIPAVQIPGNVPQGTYYLGVILDNGTDFNTANNATNSWDAVRITVGPPVPGNDFCNNAYLAGLGTYTGSTALATNDGNANCGSTTTTKDVWYAFLAPASGLARFNTCGSNYDTVLSIHSGCPGTSGNQYLCNDDSGALGPCPATFQSYLEMGVTEGTYYYLRVSGYNGASGNYVLDISMPPPSNDSCNAALPIIPNAPGSGSTRLASVDGTATCGVSANAHDVWYYFVPPYDATAQLHTCGSAYDTVLSVHTSCPGSSDNQLGCNDDAGNNGQCPFTLQSYLTVQVHAGQTYYVRVSGYNGASGSYNLFLNYLAPANDTCANAVTITQAVTPYNNTLCTDDPTADAACQDVAGETRIRADMWFRYTATCNGSVTVTTCGSSYDSKLGLYAACPGGNNQVLSCNDDFCGLQSSVSAPAFNGQVFLIRVGGYQGSAGAGVLNVSCTSNCPPDFNDDGFLDFFDADAFVACFEGIECPPGKTADYNNDGFVDFFDIDSFTFDFENGC